MNTDVVFSPTSSFDISDTVLFCRTALKQSGVGGGEGGGASKVEFLARPAVLTSDHPPSPPY